MKRYYPWLIAILGLLMLMVSNGLTITGITAFDPSLLSEFGWSRAVLKFRDLLTLLLAGLMAPFLGMLIDRVGPKRLALVGSLMLAALYFAYGYVHSIGMVYLIHVGFAAVLVAAGLNVAVIMVSQWFVTKRGVALGITLVGTSLGGVVLPKIIVAMLPALGWRESFMWLSVVPLVLFVLVLLLVRTPAQMGMQPYGARDAKAGAGETAATDELPDIGYAAAIRTPTFWALAMVAMTTFYSILSVSAHLFLYMRDMGFDLATAGNAMAVMYGMAMIGKFVLGFLADYYAPKRVFLINIAIMIGGAVLLAGMKPGLIWYALVLFGLGWGGLYTMIQLLAVNAFGLSSAGKILGTITLLDATSGGLGIWITALLYDHFGSYHVAFLVIAVLIVAAFIAGFRVRNERQQLVLQDAPKPAMR
ncbi:MFS transporter [Rhodanobacter sp. AS-Z3]|uniref:MFS transporter n=1 Tax=Rhodanobacter sp. AS-Z3 TaxID=3031330 RepID=UPI0024795B2F|nr:MFS transporter [Rhodanobacter sp. AS-Z3]WEN14119.1 MFS transporter [Rhodanobacter sp. AS-Z3]